MFQSPAILGFFTTVLRRDCGFDIDLL